MSYCTYTRTNFIMFMSANGLIKAGTFTVRTHTNIVCLEAAYQRFYLNLEFGTGL